MRLFVLTALAAGFAIGAQAETFTFSSMGTIVAQVVVPGANGTTREAGVSDFKGTMTMGGRTVASIGHCAAWPSLPGDIFQTHGQCTFSDANGGGYLRFGCNPAKAAMEANCVGGLWGTSGSYNGRNGTMAWHDKPAPDGKSGMTEGAGQWGD